MAYGGGVSTYGGNKNRGKKRHKRKKEKVATAKREDELVGFCLGFC